MSWRPTSRRTSQQSRSWRRSWSSSRQSVRRTRRLWPWPKVCERRRRPNSTRSRRSLWALSSSSALPSRRCRRILSLQSCCRRVARHPRQPRMRSFRPPSWSVALPASSPTEWPWTWRTLILRFHLARPWRTWWVRHSTAYRRCTLARLQLLFRSLPATNRTTHALAKFSVSSSRCRKRWRATSVMRRRRNWIARRASRS
mmetsp:Transcript_41838/g.100505  ORF Transcript_41838/g.100505 Transcript_41838/m.100505 type:complete len:200 (-) Transcript_41838:1339-1938(-)